MSRSRELTVRSGDVSLAGTLWLPGAGRPSATALMHPGSGPSDRHNDVFFPPIREHLLEAGIAVCSFDKRGVGGSTGRWQDAAIVEQADDLLACVATLLSDEGSGTPVGIFGHSQGGWVVVEAAARDAPIAFAVTSSGPGVTPAAQERYSALCALERAGISPERIDDAIRGVDALVEMVRDRVPLEEARARVREAGLGGVFDELELPFLPEDAAAWDFVCALIDYDPRPALERISVPLLALFGADDTIVPVEESVAVYRAAVPPELLTVAVLPGDHRLQTGDPPRLTEGYVETLSAFITSAVSR